MTEFFPEKSRWLFDWTGLWNALCSPKDWLHHYRKRILLCVCFCHSVPVLEGSPPVIEKRPQNLSVIAGQSARFVCKVTGAPQPVVTWYKGRAHSHWQE